MRVADPLETGGGTADQEMDLLRHWEVGKGVSHRTIPVGTLVLAPRRRLSVEAVAALSAAWSTTSATGVVFDLRNVGVDLDGLDALVALAHTVDHTWVRTTGTSHLASDRPGASWIPLIG